METWKINNTIETPRGSVSILVNINFTSNGKTFTTFDRTKNEAGTDDYIGYFGTESVYPYDEGAWNDQAYRTVTFATNPTGSLRSWLDMNAVVVPKKLYINGKLATINGKQKGTWYGSAWDNTVSAYEYYVDGTTLTVVKAPYTLSGTTLTIT